LFQFLKRDFGRDYQTIDGIDNSLHGRRGKDIGGPFVDDVVLYLGPGFRYHRPDLDLYSERVKTLKPRLFPFEHHLPRLVSVVFPVLIGLFKISRVPWLICVFLNLQVSALGTFSPTRDRTKEMFYVEALPNLFHYLKGVAGEVQFNANPNKAPIS